MFIERSNVFFGIVIFGVVALIAKLVRDHLPDKRFTLSRNDIIYTILAVIAALSLLFSSVI